MQAERIDSRLVNLVEQACSVFSELPSSVAVLEHQALFATVAQFASKLFTFSELGVAFDERRNRMNLFESQDDRAPQRTLARLAAQESQLAEQVQRLILRGHNHSEVYQYAERVVTMIRTFSQALAVALNR